MVMFSRNQSSKSQHFVSHGQTEDLNPQLRGRQKMVRLSASHESLLNVGDTSELHEDNHLQIVLLFQLPGK